MPTVNFADESYAEGDRTYTFASASRPDKVHTVVVSNGTAKCTCEGWQYRQHCKHIDMIPEGDDA